VRWGQEVSAVNKKKPGATGKTEQTTDAEAAKAAAAGVSNRRKNGGWQEIEARREKAALKASLADVWDEDFDLDEEILAELDHKAEFFTDQGDAEEEEFEDDEDIDEFYEDDDV
jgi:hypothetical protein